MKNEYHNVRNQIVRLVTKKHKSASFDLKAWDNVKNGVRYTCIKCVFVQTPTDAEDSTENEKITSFEIAVDKAVKGARLTFEVPIQMLKRWVREPVGPGLPARMFFEYEDGNMCLNGPVLRHGSVPVCTKYFFHTSVFDGDIIMQFARSTRCKNMQVTVGSDVCDAGIFEVGEFKMLLAPLR